MDKNIKGSLAALVANIIFGFSFLFSKVALGYANPLIILAVRFTVAFLVLNLLWLFGIVKLNLKGKPKKKLILMALAQPLLYFIFELYGIEKSSSALSGVIISLVPVAVILLSTFVLKERPTLKQILFSVLSLSAVIVISLLSNDGGNNSLIGIILLLGAVVCAAVFNILSRSESERFTPFERTYMMFLIGTIGFNIIALVTLRENFFSELTVAVSSLEFWGAVGYLSVLSSIAAFMLYNYSTSVISSVRAASFSNIITVISVFAGLIILKENLSVPQIICSFLIIIGVFGVNKK
jgi:drug/metabolite transporter (DMT)-like permease